METPLIRKARLQSFEWHEGQMYGTLPYCFHIMDVVRNLIDFGYNDEEMIVAGYFHDSIEDVDTVTQEVIASLFGKKVGKLVHAVSGEGKNRVEKKKCMLDRLGEYPKAVPLKMADRLANIRNCASNNTRMLGMYAKEMADYKELFEQTDPAMYQEMMELCKGV